MYILRRSWTPSLLLLSAFLWFAIPSVAQAPGLPLPPPPPPRNLPASGSDELRERQAKEAAKKANMKRQEALKNDTDKLYKLATELKESVDKSNANVLSLDVMKKAEEIEKLAHRVKEKMKGPS